MAWVEIDALEYGRCIHGHTLVKQGPTMLYGGTFREYAPTKQDRATYRFEHSWDAGLSVERYLRWEDE